VRCDASLRRELVYLQLGSLCRLSEALNTTPPTLPKAHLNPPLHMHPSKTHLTYIIPTPPNDASPHAKNRNAAPPLTTHNRSSSLPKSLSTRLLHNAKKDTFDPSDTYRETARQSSFVRNKQRGIDVSHLSDMGVCVSCAEARREWSRGRSDEGRGFRIVTLYSMPMLIMRVQ